MFQYLILVIALLSYIQLQTCQYQTYLFIYGLNQNSALTLSVDHSVPLKTAMMNDDRPNAFRSVSRKPGLQIWTVDVSLVSDSLMSYRLYSCIIRFVGFDFGRK